MIKKCKSCGHDCHCAYNRHNCKDGCICSNCKCIKIEEKTEMKKSKLGNFLTWPLHCIVWPFKKVLAWFSSELPKSKK